MNLLAGIVAWLTDPRHWQGSDGIPNRIGEHLALSATGLGMALIVAVPLGVWIGHSNRGSAIVINLANIGRSIPSLAWLAFALPFAFSLRLGLGFWPTVFSLVPLAIPLMLINAYTAIREVDPDLIEAGQGLGLTGWEILRDIELPLGAPLIVAGIRNAAVTVVATATLGAVVASGGLGRYLVDGLARQETERLVVGALLVAGLAILTELLFGRIEAFLSRAINVTSRPG